VVACGWTLDTGCDPNWAGYPDEVKTRATDWATGILDALTGHRYEQCPVILRPCGRRCGRLNGYMVWPVTMTGSSGALAPWMVPYVDNGVWRNCGCTGGCSCEARCQAFMPFPVARVDQVMDQGTVLDPSAYRLDNGRILVRTDGDCWQECQDYNLPDTDPNTWSVTLTPGELLPRMGQIAAGELASQFAKACVGAGDCQLPAELVSLTRNGVQLEMPDPATLVDNGLTGLFNVDLFLRAANPGRLKARPRVFSSDLPRDRQVTA
jgi:hypothetical protein